MVDIGKRKSKEPFKDFRRIQLRKKIIIFVIFIPLSDILSVRLSVRMEELGSHQKDYHEIWHMKI
jgi:hypothetical protein